MGKKDERQWWAITLLVSLPKAEQSFEVLVSAFYKVTEDTVAQKGEVTCPSSLGFETEPNLNLDFAIFLMGSPALNSHVLQSPIRFQELVLSEIFLTTQSQA